MKEGSKYFTNEIQLFSKTWVKSLPVEVNMDPGAKTTQEAKLDHFYQHVCGASILPMGGGWHGQ